MDTHQKKVGQGHSLSCRKTLQVYAPLKPISVMHFNPPAPWEPTVLRVYHYIDPISGINPWMTKILAFLWPKVNWLTFSAEFFSYKFSVIVFQNCNCNCLFYYWTYLHNVLVNFRMKRWQTNKTNTMIVY